MAAAHQLPDWLTPKSAPWQALVAGVQAGSQIAANRLRAQQIYAEAQQQQQRMDLAERNFVASNEAQTLQNEAMRLKMVHDTEDFVTLRATLKELETTDDITKVKLPVLRDPKRMEQASQLYAERMTQAGNAELARRISEDTANGFTPDSPEYQISIAQTVKKFPQIADQPYFKKVMELGPAAETARVKEEYWRDQIAVRNRQVGLQERLADDAGWVQPEGDAPGYFLDAKGNAKYPPRRLADGTSFQPKETTVGTTRLVQVSPNKWQVVDRAMPAGKITDVEREQLKDMRSQLAALMSTFGEQKDIDALKTKIDSVYAKVQSREDKPLPLKTDLKQPITKEEYDKLPRGAEYVAPDGSTRTKQ